MGLKEDLERFREVGEENREDLEEFINYGEISAGDDIKVPIKIIDLPSFEYDKFDMGGIGQGDGDVGDVIEFPDDCDGEEGKDDEAGEDGGEHGYYDMDPEEFAEELDEQLGLNLEPKGKTIKEVTEGAMVDRVRSGPDSTLDFETMYKKGLKRKMAMYFDEDYMREVLKVDGFGVDIVFDWARKNNVPVSRNWLETQYSDIPLSERTIYDSPEDIDREHEPTPKAADIDTIPFREQDKRHKYPEITKDYEKNAVIVMIRDVSGSMREHKRKLVERIFTPLDWYLTGKYDNAEFIYIAHDAEAWEVERRKFFGIKSGGGTRISSAYELTKEKLESEYPWSDWNRYVFAAGDGENMADDSRENVVPLMKEIDANLHAYLEVENDNRLSFSGRHADIVEEELSDEDDVVVTYADESDDAIKCIEEILSTEGESE